MPRLTSSQMKALKLATEHHPKPITWNDFVKVRLPSLCGSTTKGLVARGLMAGNKDDGWTITFDGSVAYRHGKY